MISLCLLLLMCQLSVFVGLFHTCFVVDVFNVDDMHFVDVLNVSDIYFVDVLNDVYFECGWYIWCINVGDRYIVCGHYNVMMIEAQVCVLAGASSHPTNL